MKIEKKTLDRFQFRVYDFEYSSNSKKRVDSFVKTFGCNYELDKTIIILLQCDLTKYLKQKLKFKKRRSSFVYKIEVDKIAQEFFKSTKLLKRKKFI